MNQRMEIWEINEGKVNLALRVRKDSYVHKYAKDV
jgi:hypothetical protein